MTFQYILRSIAITLIGAIGLISFSSCKKYLDVRAEKGKLTPETLSDLQALLDNRFVIDIRSPRLLEMVTDDYYITSAQWSSLPVEKRLYYIWDKDVTWLDPWNFTYQNPIYYANFILDQLPRIKFDEKNVSSYNSIKGSALFMRAFAFHQLAQLYCLPYTSSSNTDLGIPLRLTADVTVKSIRSTVQETYDRILGDLKEATNLLPEVTPYPTRPNKAAAYGAIARTYLAMRDYIKAKQYSDSCLARINTLLDYNTLVNPASSNPFQRFNAEVISYNFLDPDLPRPNGLIDSTLYNLYDSNDLRKIVFFRANTGSLSGTYVYKGSYEGSINNVLFDGITTGEMYLIRAECKARFGDINGAMSDLNTLMRKRWKSGTFNDYTASTPDEAKNIILTERRKELIYRGLRWSDLRRLNLEGANITLKRVINGVTYTLPPNDLRWVLLIPQKVIDLTGMQQNPR